MNRAHAVAPERGIGDLLAGAQFVDAYSVVAPSGVADAMEAARRMIARSPDWATRLMALRNTLVKPLGLKVDGGTEEGVEKLGLFPVVSATPRRVVFGFEDRHLDFRGVVDVADAPELAGASRVTLSTLVRLHNLFGRAYLTAILPFHGRIVRGWLDELAR